MQDANQIHENYSEKANLCINFTHSQSKQFQKYNMQTWKSIVIVSWPLIGAVYCISIGVTVVIRDTHSHIRFRNGHVFQIFQKWILHFWFLRNVFIT